MPGNNCTRYFYHRPTLRHTTPHIFACPFPPLFSPSPLPSLLPLLLSVCMVLYHHDHDMACTTNSTVRSSHHCSTLHLTVADTSHCTALACSVPAIRHHLGGAAGGDPDGKEADEKACEVREHVGCVSHDGQAVGQATSCKVMQPRTGNGHTRPTHAQQYSSTLDPLCCPALTPLRLLWSRRPVAEKV